MTTSTLTVTDFILARIAEDEAVAREGALLTPMDVAFEWDADRDYLEPYLSVNPARVLAQCAAMRKIVEEASDWLEAASHWSTVESHDEEGAIVSEHFLRLLASIWSDHPDWSEEWA